MPFRRVASTLLRMSMHARFWGSLIALSALGNGSVQAQGLHLIPGVDEIASDTIDDLAIADVDSPLPVIYYNPRMTRRFGPLLTEFFLAHEYGHIHLGHTRQEIGIVIHQKGTQHPNRLSKRVNNRAYAPTPDRNLQLVLPGMRAPAAKVEGPRHLGAWGRCSGFRKADAELELASAPCRLVANCPGEPGFVPEPADSGAQRGKARHGAPRRLPRGPRH